MYQSLNVISQCRSRVQVLLNVLNLPVVDPDIGLDLIQGPKRCALKLALLVTWSDAYGRRGWEQTLVSVPSSLQAQVGHVGRVEQLEVDIVGDCLGAIGQDHYNPNLATMRSLIHISNTSRILSRSSVCTIANGRAGTYLPRWLLPPPAPPASASDTTCMRLLPVEPRVASGAPRPAWCRLPYQILSGKAMICASFVVTFQMLNCCMVVNSSPERSRGSSTGNLVFGS